MYNIFLLLCIRRCVEYFSGPALTIKSTIIPSIFIATKSSMSAFEYTPTTSEVVTSLPSFTPITTVVTLASVDTLGEGDSSLVMHGLCLLPSAHFLHFRQPNCFYFRKETLQSASSFCWEEILSGLSDSTTPFSSSWLNFLSTAVIALSSNVLITFAVFICVRHASSTLSGVPLLPVLYIEPSFILI